jgi:hypothetical protein
LEQPSKNKLLSQLDSITFDDMNSIGDVL